MPEYPPAIAKLTHGFEGLLDDELSYVVKAQQWALRNMQIELVKLRTEFYADVLVGTS